MTLEEAILGEAKEARDKVLEARHEIERAGADYHHHIRRLHAAGGSMREIAESLGLSHQRVHQIVGDPADAAESDLRRMRRSRRHFRMGPFERFTRRARKVVVFAQEEARELGHDYIGTEHLLLGLLRETRGGAYTALEALGVRLEDVRADLGKLVGAGTGTPGGRLPFTPKAKKALEVSLLEARHRRQGWLGTEHILLALVREDDGIAVQILRERGTDADAVRAQVELLLGEAAA